MIKLFVIFIGMIAFCNVNAEVKVTLKPVKEIAIYPEVRIPASVISLNDAKISAEVRATVKKIPVLVGNTVQSKDILVELDSRDFRLSLKRAQVALKGIESRLKLAKYQLEQAKALSKEKAITDELLRQRLSDVTSLQSELEAQKVAVDIAEQELEKCRIRAPFDAVVVERLAQVGELANPGTPLVRIVDISRIEVTANIQPQDVDSFDQASHFDFVTLDREYPLQVRKLTPILDPIQRSREARLIFAEKQALPGSTGTLIWRQSTPHLPASLIVQRNKQLGFFTINDETAKFIAIPKASEGRPGRVELGLTAKIIVDGRFTVQDGDVISAD